MFPSSSRENLRTRYLKQSDIDMLTSNHPEIEAYGFCPTCDGKGSYLFRSSRNKACDCELQRQLYKHYLAAGIPTSYQRLDWRDFEGSKDILKVAKKYMNRLDKYIKSNIGLYLTGDNGTGKTFILCMMLKDLVCMGYKCYFVTADDMFAMKTDGWRDDEEKERYNEKVRNSQILVIDDIGKEFTNRLTKQSFESLIRYRVQNSLTTLISSNLPEKQLAAEHGTSFRSLIKGSFLIAEAKGDDFRPIALEKRIEEIDKEWVRPIL